MPSPLAELYAALGAALRPLGLRWYVFGAQAAILHGVARLTADVDVTVEPRTASVATIAAALGAAGFAARVEDVEAFAAKTRVVPLVHMASGIPVDVVLAGPGLEERFADRARPIRLEGVEVYVASPEDLIAMKILAGRSKDLDDAATILATRRGSIAVDAIRETLGILESALDRRDLLATLDALCARAGST